MKTVHIFKNYGDDTPFQSITKALDNAGINYKVDYTYNKETYESEHHIDVSNGNYAIALPLVEGAIAEFNESAINWVAAPELETLRGTHDHICRVKAENCRSGWYFGCYYGEDVYNDTMFEYAKAITKCSNMPADRDIWAEKDGMLIHVSKATWDEWVIDSYTLKEVEHAK